MRYAKTVTNSNSQFYIDTKRYVYDSLNIEDELFFCFWLNQMRVIDDILLFIQYAIFSKRKPKWNDLTAAYPHLVTQRCRHNLKFPHRVNSQNSNGIPKLLLRIWLCVFFTEHT